MSDQDKTKKPVELAIQLGNSLGLKLNKPTENENSSKKKKKTKKSFLLKEFEKIEQHIHFTTQLYRNQSMKNYLPIYKIFVCSIFLLCSFKASAISCQELAKIADENSGISITKYTYSVKGKKGFRTYFHSAPSNKCKIKDLFIIPKDSVIAYSYFKYENKDWMYIMYIDKKGNYPSGWVLEKDFKQEGTINTPLN